jgi:hypothetical protein
MVQALLGMVQALRELALDCGLVRRLQAGNRTHPAADLVASLTGG